MKQSDLMSSNKRFGAFFRASRKALGLTLREFCRRNGFDPGNVSRLERGLTAPPQAQEGLESCAKALRLERGTDRWNTFFELAAAETGRIPPEFLQSPGTVERLPNLFRGLRSGGQRHTNWVRARHLEAWAESRDAQATLPQLVRRLIRATGKDIRQEVRVYDSATLEEWLERVPPVDAWLAGILGLRPEGLTVIDEYWENLQAMTDPSLKPEVFLTSREKEVEKLEQWLKGPAAAMVIEARSPADAIDFVVAYSRDPSKVDVFAARALIVESKDAWRAIAASSDTQLLLIAHPSLPVEPEMVAEAVRHGHHVLLSANQAPSERVLSLRLLRAYRHDLEKALVSSGLDEERARRSARESGGSLTVLKRLLGRFPGTTQPEWSRPPDAFPLVPMLLAGSWDQSSDGDRSALEKLADRPYRDVLAVAERWLRISDSPLMRAGSRLSLLSRDDSWFLLAPSVAADQLRRFEKVALEVLGENDPAYELPPNKRWQASLHKKVPRYSPALRTGLAETLALLGGRPEQITVSLGLKDRVEQIVRSLLDGQDWVRWASLSSQLPLLAEAAPEAFLDAVERDLQREEPALLKLFKQEGELLFSLNPHTGLLWALEVLAWNRSLLPQVSLILAWLDEHDLGGKLGNCPSRSLQGIFMPWFPQTTAPVGERVKVLRELARRRPEAGWRLLVSLLSGQVPPSSPIHRPMWRDWALSWSGRVTNAEYWHQVGACAHLLVEHLGKDLGRWEQLLEQFDNLPEPVQREFLGRLNDLDVTTLDAKFRRAITDALREKVSRHRRYSDADWALPGEVLSELERVQSRFEPEDAVARNAWLFGPHWSVSEKLEGQGVDVAKRRRAGLRDVLSQAGWKGILGLVEAAEAPEEVGEALGEDGSNENEARILPAFLGSLDEKVSRFARGFVLGRYRTKGWDWVSRLDTKSWSAEEMARLLLDLPFERRTWEFAASKGPEVAEYYWKYTPALFRGADGDEVTLAVSMLLAHKRPSPAFHVLRMAIHEKAALEPSLLMDALEAGLDPEADDRGKGRRGNFKYDLHLLFQELQKGVKGQDARVDRDRLARLEWAYLGLLNGHPASPVTLHARLRDNPDFFVEVLGLIVPSKNEPDEDKKDVSEEDKARIQNARLLLRSWHEVPGSRDDGTVDEKLLLGWVRKARALAEEQGRLEVCDSQIGEVLAYDLERPGEPWPAIPVRDTIEEIGTDEVFRGFQWGIGDQRGKYWKPPAEGGDQGRALATKYRDFAEASKIEWPKTAAVLRRVAQGYEEDARREDAEAALEY
jgi:transcriptional regulator with XRE-family HTH domain